MSADAQERDPCAGCSALWQYAVQSRPVCGLASADGRPIQYGAEECIRAQPPRGAKRRGRR